MTWDYFVFLVDNMDLKETLEPPEGLAGGFVDEVSVRFFQSDKENARDRYMQHARDDLNLPDLILQTVPDFSNLLSSDWLAFQVDFELLTPWYSKDDRLFHVMDNPVRKDRIFGVPFMAASSWKGMLRWACRMQAGLREHLEQHNGKLDGWQDPNWILHLFGNEKGKGEDFHRGALVFYPTWFDKIDFEVINPHSRERRAGTKPIYYEVVPGRTIQVKKKPDGAEEKEEVEGARGTLSLLYAPWPGIKSHPKPEDVLPKLLESIEALLTTYGISAKRTVGWGTASITEWKVYQKRYAEPLKATREEFEKWKDEEASRQDKRFWEFVWEQIKAWSCSGGTP